ncbi:TPA: ribosome small subunit-dependent GTPase A [Streptococcus suis]|nr:ribosome small subunit-dependent GTPase A [Streptococcus suis]
MKQKSFALKMTRKTELARVLSETRTSYIVGQADGKTFSVDKGKINSYVGDIVELEQIGSQMKIKSIQERKNLVSKARNKTSKSYRYSKDSHVLATNVDQIFILLAVNQNLTLSKLERYALVFGQKNIQLLFVLTKIDLVDDWAPFIQEVKELYPQLTIIPVSIYRPDSLKELARHFSPEGIGLLLGSSGAVKSSLINHFRGEELHAVSPVRSDVKGKHTTTASYFLYSPELDYYFIDTPGFKGIDRHDSFYLSILFDDILELADWCRFSDCHHQTEKACAVKQAVEDGRLRSKKLERYRKIVI